MNTNYSQQLGSWSPFQQSGGQGAANSIFQQFSPPAASPFASMTGTPAGAANLPTALPGVQGDIGGSIQNSIQQIVNTIASAVQQIVSAVVQNVLSGLGLGQSSSCPCAFTAANPISAANSNAQAATSFAEKPGGFGLGNIFDLAGSAFSDFLGGFFGTEKKPEKDELSAIAGPVAAAASAATGGSSGFLGSVVGSLGGLF